MQDQNEKNEVESEEEEETQSDKHILFQNDNYDNAVINAVWLGKKMPSRKQVMMENRNVSTRRGQAQTKDIAKKTLDDQKPTLELVKLVILDIETAYSDAGLPTQREWEVKGIREEVRSLI